MSYTTEFIERVKTLFPEAKTMHELAESGSFFLGGHLCDLTENDFFYKIVVSAIDNGEIDELRRIAQLEIDRRKLWLEWQETDIAKQSRKQNGKQ